MKTWAHHPGGTVSETVELSDDLTPGEDIFTPEFAADLTDVTGVNPRPAFGWATADGGKTFKAPPAPAEPVPDAVSGAQAKIQLLRAGFLDGVQHSVEAIGGEVAIWFSDARVWQRDNPHVNEIGEGLHLTAEQIDDLFRDAAKIAA